MKWEDVLGQEIRKNLQRFWDWLTGLFGSKKAKRVANKTIGIKDRIEKKRDTKMAQTAELIKIRNKNRGITRAGGKLGDETICGFIPFLDTVGKMTRNNNFKIDIVRALNEIYENIRDYMYKRIGNPNPAAMERMGVVPRDTGGLRRSIQWSLSRKYAIVPDISTEPKDIQLLVWIFANKRYAEAVSDMDRIKGRCDGPPAVQHPIAQCPRLNRSRKTGIQKFDPAARPDYFDVLVADGRRKARREYHSHPIISNNFKLDTSGSFRV